MKKKTSQGKELETTNWKGKMSLAFGDASLIANPPPHTPSPLKRQILREEPIGRGRFGGVFMIDTKDDDSQLDFEQFRRRHLARRSVGRRLSTGRESVSRRASLSGVADSELSATDPTKPRIPRRFSACRRASLKRRQHAKPRPSIDPHPRFLAMKRQIVSASNDQATVDLLAFERLSTLVEARQSNNFPVNYGAFAKKEVQNKRTVIQLNYLMDLSQVTLMRLKRNKTLTMGLLREILFQIMWGLFVAQTRFSFVHHDLHAGNVMVREEDKDHIYYHTGKDVAWKTRHCVAKLIDFGSAFLVDGDQIIGHQPRQSFDSKTDIRKVGEELTGTAIVKAEDEDDEAHKEDRKKFNHLRKNMRTAGMNGHFNTPEVAPQQLTRRTFSSTRSSSPCSVP